MKVIVKAKYGYMFFQTATMAHKLVNYPPVLNDTDLLQANNRKVKPC